MLFQTSRNEENVGRGHTITTQARDVDIHHRQDHGEEHEQKQHHNVSFLTSKTVESTALSLESIDDIHRNDGLSTSMFSVGDGVLDDGFEEDFEDITRLFINQTGDTLDSATTSQTANGRLCDSLDVIAQHLAMTLGASLSQTFSAFTTARHDDLR